MIANCQHCGAPLNLNPATKTARCHYCKNVNRVRNMQTVLPETPVGWQPPPAWVPPPQYQLPQSALQYHRPSSAGPMLLVLVSGLGVALVGIAGVVVMILGQSSSSVTVSQGGPPATPNAPFPLPVKTLPATRGSPRSDDKMVCTGGTKTVSNQQLGTVVATSDCVVTLTGCTLSGSPGIIANGTGKVIMIGGALRPSGPLAVVATDRAVVELRGVSVSGQILEQGSARVIR